MDINNILLDLEIIHQLQENDKLSVNILPGTTKLFVNSSGYFTGVTRWYKGYNREDSISYVEKLIETINKASCTIVSGSHNDLAERLNTGIMNGLKGLENLKKTYISDSIITAKLVLIMNKLNTILKYIESNFPDLAVSELDEIETNTPVNDVHE